MPKDLRLVLQQRNAVQGDLRNYINTKKINTNKFVSYDLRNKLQKQQRIPLSRFDLRHKLQHKQTSN